MENEKQINQPGNLVEDAILQFLADNHPDDEAQLDAMLSLLQNQEAVPSVDVLENIYKGIRYEKDVEDARQQGYLSGVNEKIEVEKRLQHPQPVDDGGIEPIADDLPLLRCFRRSVWDL